MSSSFSSSLGLRSKNRVEQRGLSLLMARLNSLQNEPVDLPSPSTTLSIHTLHVLLCCDILISFCYMMFWRRRQDLHLQGCLGPTEFKSASLIILGTSPYLFGGRHGSRSHDTHGVLLVFETSSSSIRTSSLFYWRLWRGSNPRCRRFRVSR